MPFLSKTVKYISFKEAYDNMLKNKLKRTSNWFKKIITNVIVQIVRVRQKKQTNKQTVTKESKVNLL